MISRAIGTVIAWAIVGVLGMIVLLLLAWLVLALAGVVVSLAVGLVP